MIQLSPQLRSAINGYYRCPSCRHSLAIYGADGLSCHSCRCQHAAIIAWHIFDRPNPFRLNERDPSASTVIRSDNE